MNIAYEDMILRGLWDPEKDPSSKLSNPVMKKHGYDLFHSGENSDFFMKSESGKVKDVIVLRNNQIKEDDLSVNLIIPGKGELFNSISMIGSDFSENHGVKTTAKYSNSLPLDLSRKTQTIEMGIALEVDFGNMGYKRVKFMFFNYVSKYFYQRAYGMNFSSSLDDSSEIEALFFPVFIPVSSENKHHTFDRDIVKEEYGDIVSELKELFVQFTNFAGSRGIVVFHSVFEVFFDRDRNWSLSCDAFSPANTRYISLDGFNNKYYQPMESQFLFKHCVRENNNSIFGRFSAKKLGRILKRYNDKEALSGYREIYELLS